MSGTILITGSMGGPNAPIPAQESVAGLKKILPATGPKESGHFFNYDGSGIPW